MMKKSAFIIAVGFCAIAALAAHAGDDKSFEPLFPVMLNHDFPEPEKTFHETMDLILKNYYTAGVDEKTLYWAAIQGMLRQISPPQNPDLAKIWTDEEYARVQDSLNGVQVSLGFQSTFNPREGSLVVNAITPGSPSEDILRPLDRILRIGQEPLRGKSVIQVQKMLSGKEGDQVVLTVNRDIKVFDVTLTHEKVEMENIVATPLDSTVALVEIRRFTSDAAGKLKGELEKLDKQGVKGLIMDFRNDPGGVFMQALAVAELFLPEKAVMLRTLQRDTKQTNYVSANAHPFTFDIIILVNKNTASSAEIVAASLRDNGRATIVGTRTLGKGVFEKTFTLDNECRVKFITGAMYSPLGMSWQGRGLAPDFLVDQDTKTVAVLQKLPPAKRMLSDVAIITARKLLIR